MSTGRRTHQEEPACARYQPGESIAGKYVLERRIGAGAMGAVWIAFHQELGARVAIKLMRSDLYPSGMHPLLAERFLREAKAAARIHHPAIVRVFDYGVTSREDPFIVMELLRGEGLRATLVRQRTLEPGRAVALMLPIASGLDAVHARGVVHRDLKPDNILLATDDSGRVQPKLVDFGVAKLSFLGPRAPALTGVALIGTPEYMAPEQALALEQVDERADLWAFCVCLYELISGRVPFPGRTFEEVLRPIVQDDPVSLVERAGLDPGLWTIIEQGLRKVPEDRQRSVRELGEQLAAWLRRRGIDEDAAGASLRQQWNVPPAVVLPSAQAAPAERRSQATETIAMPLVRLHQAEPRQALRPRSRASAIGIAAVVTSLMASAWGAHLLTSGPAARLPATLPTTSARATHELETRSWPPFVATASASSAIPVLTTPAGPPQPIATSPVAPSPPSSLSRAHPVAGRAGMLTPPLMPVFHPAAAQSVATSGYGPSGAPSGPPVINDAEPEPEPEPDGTDDRCPYGCEPPQELQPEPNPYDDEDESGGS